MTENNYIRDELIYAEWVSIGRKQSEIAKEYGLTTTRVYQICKNIKQEHKNPNYVKTYLYHKYPNVRKATISGAVNAVLRHFASDNIFIWKQDEAINSKEYFFKCLDNISDEDVRYLRSIGPVKLAFIKELRLSHNQGII